MVDYTLARVPVINTSLSLVWLGQIDYPEYYYHLPRFDLTTSIRGTTTKDRAQKATKGTPNVILGQPWMYS